MLVCVINNTFLISPHPEAVSFSRSRILRKECRHYFFVSILADLRWSTWGEGGIGLEKINIQT